MSTSDSRDGDGLGRFVEAQRTHYAIALSELQRGRKTSHWMWFVFPQLRGLGSSVMAHRYGITGLGEARAYLAHPVLGPRLCECVDTLLRHRNEDAAAILGDIDAMKLRSSLTLFALAAPTEPVFRDALEAFFGGTMDARTRALLEPGLRADE